MNLKNMVVDHNSEELFRDRLLNVLASGAGLVHVRSAETMRALYGIRNTVIMEGHEYHEWDVVKGNRQFRHSDIMSHDVEHDSQPNVLSPLQMAWEKFLWWGKDATPDDQGVDYVYTLVNPQYQLGQNPAAYQRFMEMCHHLPESTVRLIIVTDDITLPETYAHHFVTIDFDLPGHTELLNRLRDNLGDYADPETLSVTEDDEDMIAVAAAGMSVQDFDVAVASTVVDAMYGGDPEDEINITADDLIKGVHKAKTEAIRKNDILELLESGNMSEVGGMDNAKNWVRQRSNCYSEQALAFGVEPPKGMVSVGVPGSGKSLLAKAVGNELGIPVVRLDFGKVFNSLVGSSEERMRKALKLIEAMSPCVLFVDEIDKGLGGLGGSGDSGTSMRVFGTFLTWLQDNKKPVFTMVTANNVTGLPPELLRRGRFDAIFSTELPNRYEREDVLEIHLRKRGHDISEFSEDELAEIIEATDECVPAEIESLVKDALVLALDENMEEPKLEARHVLEAREQMVPLSKSHKDAIEAMVAWAKDNATPASYSEKQLAEVRGSLPKKSGRTPRKTRRKSNVTSLADKKRGK